MGNFTALPATEVVMTLAGVGDLASAVVPSHHAAKPSQTTARKRPATPLAIDNSLSLNAADNQPQMSHARDDVVNRIDLVTADT
jgi:hypothetical protein